MPMLHTLEASAEAAWAAPISVGVALAISVAPISVILVEIPSAEWVVPVLPMLAEWELAVGPTGTVTGTVGRCRTRTTGTAIGTAATTLTMITIASTIDSSVSAGGLPTMPTITAMVAVRGCGAKLSLPEAPIGGTATTAVRTTTDE